MRVLTFRCDDAAGFELKILCANDGDFHLSVVPCGEDMEPEERVLNAACYGASVRVRMPMIGGGAHEMLWTKIAELFNAAEPSSTKVEELPEWMRRIEAVKDAIADDYSDVNDVTHAWQQLEQSVVAALKLADFKLQQGT